jgi:hypothetical protein
MEKILPNKSKAYLCLVYPKKEIMTEQGLGDGRKEPHSTKISEQLESNYIERVSPISSESRLKRRIMIIDDNSDNR